MRRLKVDVDLDSGYVVLKLPVRDFKEVAVAATLNCYDGRERGRKDSDPEYVAYHNGLLHFIKGIECLIDMQTWPNAFEDPIPLIQRGVKERRAAVEHEIRERKLLDQIMETAIAEAKARKKDS